MIATMPAKSEKKVNIGVRVLPAKKTRLEQIAAEISRESYPASVTAGELAEAAINEFIERYDKGKGKAGK